MTWDDDLEELRYRRQLAEGMGGEEGIARQHARGKLTVRERIPRLVDPGSFRQFGALRGSGTYDDGGRLKGFVPDAKVEGSGLVDGRKVILTAGDFTIRGGSEAGSRGELGTELSATERALQWRVPLVRLLDAAGGSVRSFETLGRTYLPDANSFTRWDVELLSVAPVVSAVLGAAAGIAALHTSLAHWNVMIRHKSQVFPGGPPVVKAALGQTVDKEELGGWHIHARQSGVVDSVVDTEDEAFAAIRQFLSYLPSSVHELPPRQAAAAAPPDNARGLLDIVTRNVRQAYNAQALVEQIVDDGSLFVIAPRYGRSRLTGLARIDGYPVGVVANDPRYNGGATDVAAGLKTIRLLQLCDTFHLPLVDFADEPGLMVGIESEKQGIERAGARLVCATNASRVPWITFVIRRLYGVGGQTHQRPTGMFRRYAWPSASWGSMHIAGGASAAYRREIEMADDPEQKRQEIEDRLRAFASPFRTAEVTGQDIIDPRDTRSLLIEFVTDAQRILAQQVGPPIIPYWP